MEKFDDEALLVAQSGQLNGESWSINSNILAGRDPACDIVIADRQVSRHHAQFVITPQGIVLEDLNSKNGTHLNGKPVSRSHVLQDGDIIQIALAQQFVYLSSDATLPLELTQIDPQKPMVSPHSRTEENKARRYHLRLDNRSRVVWIIPTRMDTHKQTDTAQHPEIEIDPPLSAYQFNLLKRLYEEMGQVISRSDLITTVWGEEQAVAVSEQAFDALVRRLRDRLGEIDPNHSYIITVRGHGLRLDNPQIEE